MRKIALTRGEFAIVDDEDYEWLSKFKWHVGKCGNILYARRRPNKGYPFTFMHRAIYEHENGDIPPRMMIDHVNGNGLDNRRENFRCVTQRQNLQNWHVKKSSQFPGICWRECRKKWLLRIYIDGKRRFLGYFDNELEAATTYRVACKVLLGVDVL
jgi:hypothetical protein